MAKGVADAAVIDARGTGANGGDVLAGEMSGAELNAFFAKRAEFLKAHPTQDTRIRAELNAQNIRNL